MVTALATAEKKKSYISLDPESALSDLDLYTETKSTNAQIRADPLWMETFCRVICQGLHKDWSETLSRTTFQTTLYIEADYTNKIFVEKVSQNTKC